MRSTSMNRPPNMDWTPSMTTPTHAGRDFFVTIPVADLSRSIAFFEALGFDFDPAFTSDDGTRVLVGAHASIMLVTREKFGELATLPVGDPTSQTLALYAFAVESREAVDTLSDAALAAGGTVAHDAEDHGFMYSRAVYDPDGHGWQVMWMDPVAVAGAEA